MLTAMAVMMIADIEANNDCNINYEDDNGGNKLTRMVLVMIMTVMMIIIITWRVLTMKKVALMSYGNESGGDNNDLTLYNGHYKKFLLRIL